MAGNLTPAERQDRQRADHKLLAVLDAADVPVSVTGHATADDVRNDRNPIPVGARTPPSHYRVVYDFPTLVAADERRQPTVVHVAPLADANYPATQPSAWVISDFVPWTPHFAAGVPICHGHHVWLANRTQLVDYVIHLGRLLNFDEPPPVPGYLGYNPNAIAYWRDVLGYRPLDPNLRFPVVRPDAVIRAGAFAPTSSPVGSGRFASAARDASRFRASQTPAPARARFARSGGTS
jgi:hypothetical protein